MRLFWEVRSLSSCGLNFKNAIILAFECDHCLSFLFKGKGRSIWRLKVRSPLSCGLNFKIAIAWDRNAKGDRFLGMRRGDAEGTA